LQDSPIHIGPISLQGFEIPASVRFGGRHRLAIHNLAGGRRVVERLGPDDGEIEFRGIFSGPGAEGRVRAFDSLRLSGEIVWLSWESFQRKVVVKSFIADYQSPWWIPYNVSCAVVHQTGAMTAQSSTVSVLISTDLGNALSAANSAEISLISLQSALASKNALTAGTSGQAQAVAAVQITRDAINNQISTQSALLVVPVGVAPESVAQTLAASVRSAGLLAAAVNAGSYVGRIGSNLNGTNI
jgi:hypothetical protein